METNKTHVVINGAKHPTGRLECLHCGSVYTPSLPCPINVYVAMLNTFGADHDQCLLRTDQRLGPALTPEEMNVD